MEPFFGILNRVIFLEVREKVDFGITRAVRRNFSRAGAAAPRNRVVGVVDVAEADDALTLSLLHNGAHTNISRKLGVGPKACGATHRKTARVRVRKPKFTPRLYKCIEKYISVDIWKYVCTYIEKKRNWRSADSRESCDPPSRAPPRPAIPCHNYLHHNAYSWLGEKKSWGKNVDALFW